MNDAALTWLEREFLYYTECELATLEHLESMKRASRSDVKRHRIIANGMLGTCAIIFGSPRMPETAAKWRLARELKCPRVFERLEALNCPSSPSEKSAPRSGT